jgi:hypothetical protein
VRGTRIVTPRGLRRIEDLAVGDHVYSFDLEARRPVVRKVGRLLRAQATEILHVAAGELVLAGVTPEHPFYDAGQESWTPAGELREGTRLIAWLGSADVREIEVTVRRDGRAAGRVEVFNLTIDGPEHNYFAEGLLVHNKEEPFTGTGTGGVGGFDPSGEICDSDADCSSHGSFYCRVSSDGSCGNQEKRCADLPVDCDLPLTTVCGCDGKTHALDPCGKGIDYDKRPESCPPPPGMFNCGEGTCSLDTHYCLQGYSEVKCADLPPSCAGAAATCACLATEGVASCDCLQFTAGGVHVTECAP